MFFALIECGYNPLALLDCLATNSEVASEGAMVDPVVTEEKIRKKKMSC